MIECMFIHSYETLLVSLISRWLSPRAPPPHHNMQKSCCWQGSSGPHVCAVGNGAAAYGTAVFIFNFFSPAATLSSNPSLPPFNLKSTPGVKNASFKLRLEAEIMVCLVQCIQPLAPDFWVSWKVMQPWHFLATSQGNYTVDPSATCLQSIATWPLNTTPQ